MPENSKITAPPYCTYKQFNNLINDLREKGMPPVVDRSVVKGSNSAKSIMIAALKHLKLINNEFIPSDLLNQLVTEPSNHNTIMNGLLKASYPFLFDDSIDLSNTTTDQVAQKFSDAGANGSTVSKCMAFFLSAAKDANISISPRVKAPLPKRNVKPRKRKPNGSGQPNTGEEDPLRDEIPEGMERITIPFREFDDGVIFLPADLDSDDAKRAIKMVNFILAEYYNLED